MPPPDPLSEFGVLLLLIGSENLSQTKSLPCVTPMRGPGVVGGTGQGGHLVAPERVRVTSTASARDDSSEALDAPRMLPCQRREADRLTPIRPFRSFHFSGCS